MCGSPQWTSAWPPPLPTPPSSCGQWPTAPVLRYISTCVLPTYPYIHNGCVKVHMYVHTYVQYVLYHLHIHTYWLFKDTIHTYICTASYPFILGVLYMYPYILYILY